MKLKNTILLLTVFSFFTACSQTNKNTNETAPKVVLVSPQDFQQKLKSENGVLLDVRTLSEYKKGHLAGSRLLDIFNDSFEVEIDKLDKNTTYFVYCAAGGRSSEAAEMMHKKGFKLVYDMDGGFSRWNSLKLPSEQ